MSKIVIPSMNERFQQFISDLSIVESADGVKAVTRKNFPLLTRLEENDGTIHVSLGEGLGLLVQENSKSGCDSSKSHAKCILIDNNAKRLQYNGCQYSRLLIWGVQYVLQDKIPTLISNLGRYGSSIIIPETSFKIREGAQHVCT